MPLPLVQFWSNRLPIDLWIIIFKERNRLQLMQRARHLSHLLAPTRIQVTQMHVQLRVGEPADYQRFDCVSFVLNYRQRPCTRHLKVHSGKLPRLEYRVVPRILQSANHGGAHNWQIIDQTEARFAMLQAVAHALECDAKKKLRVPGALLLDRMRAGKHCYVPIADFNYRPSGEIPRTGRQIGLFEYVNPHPDALKATMQRYGTPKDSVRVSTGRWNPDVWARICADLRKEWEVPHAKGVFKLPDNVPNENQWAGFFHREGQGWKLVRKLRREQVLSAHWVLQCGHRPLRLRLVTCVH